MPKGNYWNYFLALSQTSDREVCQKANYCRRFIGYISSRVWPYDLIWSMIKERRVTRKQDCPQVDRVARGSRLFAQSRSSACAPCDLIAVLLEVATWSQELFVSVCESAVTAIHLTHDTWPLSLAWNRFLQKPDERSSLLHSEMLTLIVYKEMKNNHYI